MLRTRTHVVAAALMVALGMSGVPAIAAGQAQVASLAGTPSNTGGQTLVNTAVQLRNLATNTIARSTTSHAVGQFSGHAGSMKDPAEK
jgi:hypothetical protein